MSEQRDAGAASAGDRARQHVGLRPVHPQEIDIHRRQVVERGAGVAGQRDGLQEHFRKDDGGAAVQVDAAGQARRFYRVLER